MPERHHSGVGDEPERRSSISPGDVRPLGDRALLVGAPDAAGAATLMRHLEGALGGATRNVVSGLATVMIQCADPDDVGSVRGMVEECSRSLVAGELDDHDRPPGRLVPVRCAFDGPDIDDVARVARCSVDDVIAMMTARPLTVATVGFSPGFAYLQGLPAPLRAVRRRAVPRPSVPAGSVAVANGLAAVYPAESPGGWQLLGRTDEPFFSTDAAPYARLAPGDRVQLRAVPPGAVAPAPREVADPWVTWRAPAGARRVFEVHEPGVRTTVQDSGRHGVARVGVPSAGPADPDSWLLANRLVGNGPAAAALEAVAHGPTLTCMGDAHIAVLGAPTEVTIAGRAVPTGQVVPVHAGQVVRVGAVDTSRGLRAYVAVAGGFLGPRVLGSTACDELTKIGPGPLRRGMPLWSDTPTPPLGDHLAPGLFGGARFRAGTRRVRILAGPHEEHFAPGALEWLADGTYVVAATSNRVGLRLERTGERAPLDDAHADVGELDSHGVVEGAIQWPPGGDPIVLLGDHATLGGYPIVAVVAGVDVGSLGQCAPGSTIRFEIVEPATARALWQAHTRELERAVVGHYPLVVE